MVWKGLKQFIAITYLWDRWAHGCIQQWPRSIFLLYYLLVLHATNWSKETRRESSETIVIYSITLNSVLSEMKYTTSLLIHLVFGCVRLVDYPALPIYYLRLPWINRIHFLQWSHCHRSCSFLHLLAMELIMEPVMELIIELMISPVNLVHIIDNLYLLSSKRFHDRRIKPVVWF